MAMNEHFGGFRIKRHVTLLHHLLFLELDRVGQTRQYLLTVNHLEVFDVILDLGMQLPIEW